MIVYENKIILRRVISGGQTGADQAGLFTAKAAGFETGGFAPHGFRTLIGDAPGLLRDQFGLEETVQRNYQVRTAMNVKSSDATIRLAMNFNSPGELCTLNAIRKYKKPYFDVDLSYYCGDVDRDQYINQRVDEFIEFLIANQVITLNVAGNADRSPSSGFGIHFKEASSFLLKAFIKITNEKK